MFEFVAFYNNITNEPYERIPLVDITMSELQYKKESLAFENNVPLEQIAYQLI